MRRRRCSPPIILLALGAVPSLTFAAEEIGAFVARADALMVNLGTLDRERRAAIPIALEAAAAGGKPWVLDPVFCDRSPARADLARALLSRAAGGGARQCRGDCRARQRDTGRRGL